MARAKAQAALARQSKAAGNADYSSSASWGMADISFAPVAAFALGPMARFGARAGHLLDNELSPPGETGMPASTTLAPAHAATRLPPHNALPGISGVSAHAGASIDIEQALDNYFFQQSRLPPTGGAAFNPLLSPAWAGLKLPGYTRRGLDGWWLL